jgi:hypothetical protein
MKLYAISDLHLGYRATRDFYAKLPPHPEDWLILAGDIGENEAQLRFALAIAAERFAKVIWVPGNHELWSTRDDSLRGEAKYLRQVDICREHGVLSPEDPYALWPGPPVPHRIVPLFLLYDYSFQPDGLPPKEAIAWAAETGLRCADEMYLHPDPYPSRELWCEARVHRSRLRLDKECKGEKTVLINHWPLRQDLAVLPLIPRFSIWCGTRLSEDWHTRYNATCVIYGHLHIRRTHHRHGVRFEEVSLGYPRQYNGDNGIEHYLRQILPAEEGAPLARRFV